MRQITQFHKKTLHTVGGGQSFPHPPAPSLGLGRFAPSHNYIFSSNAPPPPLLEKPGDMHHCRYLFIYLFILFYLTSLRVALSVSSIILPRAPVNTDKNTRYMFHIKYINIKRTSTK